MAEPLPQGWTRCSLDEVSEFVTSGSRGWAAYYADHGALFVRIGNLTREHINLRYDSLVHVRPPASSEGKRTRLAPGDLLISITADLGIVGVVPPGLGEAYVNQHIALVRIDASSNEPRWIGHYLAGREAQERVRANDDPGAKAGLNLPTVRALPVALPPLPEQRQIAEVLDTVDEAIRKTEQIIAKLKQVKQGLLHDLLTRGIDDNGELRDPDRHPEQFKDSPLGRIPKGWELKQGDALFKLYGGAQPSVIRADPLGKYVYLKVNDFNHPANADHLVRADNSFDRPPSSGVFTPGVVVFPKRGAAILQNRARILGVEGSVDPNLMVMAPTGALRPRFLREFLLFFDLGRICDNSGIPQINNKHIYPLQFPVPAEREQKAIENHLDLATERVEADSRELSKLRLLKQGLMEDLLTGRVRVTPLLEDAAE